uniref:Rho GTPase-activating protein 21 n=1 Tax=Timema shepardi TaxID=629360 RepID=A0A7R9AWT9_TIMSH|nr:unnamed protein product [Timema shepardi]
MRISSVSDCQHLVLAVSKPWKGIISLLCEIVMTSPSIVVCKREGIAPLRDGDTTVVVMTYVPDEPYTYSSCLPISFGGGHGLLTRRRLRRWNSSGSWTPLNISEGESSQSVDVRHSQVDIAGDYTKKKHVLRLNTQSCSELLLQAEDASDMAQWIKALQDQAGSPAEDCSSGGSTKQQQGASSVSTSRLSPLPAHKGIRKLTSFRNRSPTGQSPVNKTRKPSQTDQLPSPKSKTWKGRVAKQFRRIQQGSGSPSSPTAPYPEGVTIGIPLEDCPMVIAILRVCPSAGSCTSIVEERGLDIIGIYRVPGNTAAVSSLTEGINKGFDCVNLQQDPRWSDVNVISSLLKLFFRRLPDSLLTTELYPHFIEADKIDDSNRRLVTIKKLVHELPDHHFETLKFLLFHLKRVVDHCDKNKMEARNLAIVFGPTLVRAGDDNMVTMVTDMSHQCRIVESLITHVDWFFSDEDPEDSFPFSVPQDGAELEPATANQNLLLSNIQKVEGMKAESPSRDISAKDIVSSIISAANRKMQKAKSRKGGGGGGGGGGGSSNATSGTSGATEDGRETFTETMQDRGDDKQLVLSSDSYQVMTLFAYAITFMDADRPQQSSPSSAVAFSVAYSSNIAKSITSEENSAGSIDNCDQTNNPSGQSMLDDSSQRKGLVIGNDEVAVWTYANLSANTQERIKRFERETKAMLQRDLSRQRRDMEKHEADKKRIEQELQQAKKDLESEDLLDAIADNPSDITKNISDTIGHTGVSSRKPPTRDIKYNLSTIGRRLSSSSLPSTSSNTSFGSNASYVSVRSTPLQTSSSHVAMDQMDLSTKGSPLLGFTQTKKLGTTHFFPEAPRGPNTVTISPRNSLPSSGYSSSTLVGTRNVQQTPNRSSTRSHSSLSTVRVSLPGPEQQSLQRSGSVENLQTQLNKLTHNGTLKRMKTGNEQVINIK